jgi:hypothetical protein
MPSRELPARPNLEQLKKQAKSLLDKAKARDPEALQRFGALPSLSGRSPDAIDAADLALHDAQSVIAREHGFASWNALREEVESRTLSFDAAVDEFVRCATAGATGRAERLLALYPRIASATLQTALVLGDAAAVEERLTKRPELVRQPGGTHNWEPLLYACHTSMHKTAHGRIAGLVAIVRRLCALGADANGEYHWNWHPELPRTVLWASVCEVQHLPLAEILLEAGANRRRRRQHRGPGAAAPLRPRRQRHARRGTAARPHDAVGRYPGRGGVAARSRRRPEPRVE